MKRHKGRGGCDWGLDSIRIRQKHRSKHQICSSDKCSHVPTGIRLSRSPSRCPLLHAWNPSDSNPISTPTTMSSLLSNSRKHMPCKTKDMSTVDLGDQLFLPRTRSILLLLSKALRSRHPHIPFYPALCIHPTMTISSWVLPKYPTYFLPLSSILRRMR